MECLCKALLRALMTSLIFCSQKMGFFCFSLKILGGFTAQLRNSHHVLLLHFMHVKRAVESGKKSDAPSPSYRQIQKQSTQFLQCGLLQKSFAYSAYARTYAHMGIFRCYWVTLFSLFDPQFLYHLF